MQTNPDLDPKKFKIGVVGGGSWGTALANLLASKGYAIKWWIFEKEVKDQILETGENKIFLPNVKLPANLHPTNDLAEAVLNKNMVVVVVPSHLMREITLKAADAVPKGAIIVTAST
jgi:glycerol-3-phosphate dehydrogenase (NAD(P)+)